MNTALRALILMVAIASMSACATYKAQYSAKDDGQVFPKEKNIEHSFYLIGDAGNSPIGTKTKALETLKLQLDQAPKNSTALFLGDNIYPSGMPKSDHAQRAFAEHQLNVQTEAVANFKGNTIFIPGNHDWYSNGLNGLKRQEKYIEQKLGKNTFLPENGCPIKKVNISDAVVLIIIDSEWYVTNWDNHPTINDDCDIKTRALFFDEYESLIKKARGKTTIVALHHPLFSNGSHGGQYSFKSHLSPLPVLGTLKNLIRKTGGVVTVDEQNNKYRTLKKRLVTLSQENDKVIFVSGHDHNLQYLVQDNIPQIISGSGSKLSPTKNTGSGKFSFATQGFARLDVFKDGSSYVRFFQGNTNNIVFETQVLKPNDAQSDVFYAIETSPNKTASIYSKEETHKTKLFKALWGERYRKDFSTKITAPTVRLDTLFGGLKPVRKGGGHQSKSLRLEDSKGREYVMRALRKNALQYLQAVAFKDQYIKGQFEGTATENILLDVFTGSHPYAPFTIATLSEAIGVMHTSPKLYYVPKQNALGKYNEEFGDELYMIEERAADGHGDKKSFSFSNQLISTHDMLRELRKDEDNTVDEAAYIRARLFDMLIGDWDRHEDQWRWAEFKEGKKTIFRPMPRDRDQAFSIMNDGMLLGFVTKITPALRLMQSYDKELKSPKWFNLEPYPLDVALITKSTKAVWDAQVQHIVQQLTNEVIDDAFKKFPKEVQGNTIEGIKQKLIGRRANLQKIADAYFKQVNRYAIIKGTDKDDWFDVERSGEFTKITGYRIQKGKKGELFHQRVYSYKNTKEIWIYGLDDDDVFKVSGIGRNLIKIRIIGGQNKDVYTIENGRKVKVYDHKSKASEFVTNKGNKKLTDDYETNVYNYKKPAYNSNQLVPSLGSNPDDGLKLGITNTYTAYGFERNPFTSQHKISAAYYFATHGFDVSYLGEFANITGSANLILEARFTSPNYAINFFGFGNETPNPEAEDDDALNVGLNYNRVRFETVKIAPAIHWRGDLGSKVKFGLSYESVEVEETEGRFINTVIGDNVELYSRFVGAELFYQFENRDSKAFPTLGMETNMHVGYKTNVDDSNGFGYIIPSIAFDYGLISSGQLVLATKFAGHINIGDDFEFYQAANLGASSGLRGYRNERFTGKSLFVQTTDLRLNLKKLKTAVSPLNIGVYAGFDYGRVWLAHDVSHKWHNAFGGGLFLSAANMVTGNVSAFSGTEGLRVAFKLGFGF